MTQYHVYSTNTEADLWTTDLAEAEAEFDRLCATDGNARLTAQDGDEDEEELIDAQEKGEVQHP